MSRHDHTKGFSLVEVLFAVFILAVGILGIFGLQIVAKQSNYDAIQRTTAAALVTDMVERMRMNTTVLTSYASSSTPVPENSPMPTSCMTSVVAGVSGCTPDQIVVRDLAEWYSLISGVTESNADATRSGGLVAPSACIVRDPNGTGTDNEYSVAIAWRGRSALGNPTSSTCGQGLAGQPYGANDEYRRVFVMNVAIRTESVSTP